MRCLKRRHLPLLKSDAIIVASKPLIYETALGFPGAVSFYKSIKFILSGKLFLEMNFRKRYSRMIDNSFNKKGIFKNKGIYIVAAVYILSADAGIFGAISSSMPKTTKKEPIEPTTIDLRSIQSRRHLPIIPSEMSRIKGKTRFMIKRHQKILKISPTAAPLPCLWELI